MDVINDIMPRKNKASEREHVVDSVEEDDALSMQVPGDGELEAEG